MKLFVGPALLIIGLLLGFAGSARAQFQYYRPPTSPYAQPVLSPYLNLARPGNLAVNYFGLVRPEQQFYNSINQLNQQVGTNQLAIGSLQQNLNAPVATGHPIYFLNYRQYFMNYGTPGQTPSLRSSMAGTGAGQTGQAPAGYTRPARPSIGSPR